MNLISKSQTYHAKSGISRSLVSLANGLLVLAHPCKKVGTYFFISAVLEFHLAKALNGIQWEVAHPLMLNYGAPIASMDAIMCVSGEGTSYVGIPKGFEFQRVGNFPLDSIEGLCFTV